jgi:outer membrane murein-binding lipoprotein Lpp
VTFRRAGASALLACCVAIGAVSCSSSNDSSQPATNIDELGPQIRQLQTQVDALQREVQSLQQQLSGVTTTSRPLR